MSKKLLIEVEVPDDFIAHTDLISLQFNPLDRTRYYGTILNLDEVNGNKPSGAEVDRG